MGNKTIYVQDEKLWQKAKKLAGKAGLSGVIAKALTEFVDEHDREKHGSRRYQFEVRYEYDDIDPDADWVDCVAFEGKPLFQGTLFYQLPEGWGGDAPDDRVEVHVYQTVAGTLVLMARRLDAPEGLFFHQGSHKTLQELRQDSVVSGLAPDERARLLADLSSQLRKSLVIWID